MMDINTFVSIKHDDNTNKYGGLSMLAQTYSYGINALTPFLVTIEVDAAKGPARHDYCRAAG